MRYYVIRVDGIDLAKLPKAFDKYKAGKDPQFFVGVDGYLTTLAKAAHLDDVRVGDTLIGVSLARWNGRYGPALAHLEAMTGRYTDTVLARRILRDTASARLTAELAWLRARPQPFTAVV